MFFCSTWEPAFPVQVTRSHDEATRCVNHLKTLDVQHTSKRCKDDRHVSNMLVKLPCVILNCFAQPLRSLNLTVARRIRQIQHLAARLLTGLSSYEV